MSTYLTDYGSSDAAEIKVLTLEVEQEIVISSRIPWNGPDTKPDVRSVKLTYSQIKPAMLMMKNARMVLKMGSHKFKVGRNRVNRKRPGQKKRFPRPPEGPMELEVIVEPDSHQRQLTSVSRSRPRTFGALTDIPAVPTTLEQFWTQNPPSETNNDYGRSASEIGRSPPKPNPQDDYPVLMTPNVQLSDSALPRNCNGQQQADELYLPPIIDTRSIDKLVEAAEILLN